MSPPRKARQRTISPESLASDSSSWQIALQATLRPEYLNSFAGPLERDNGFSLGSGKGQILDDSFYKSRGRVSPTLRDLQAKSQTLDTQSPSCICEVCDCGKHSCPMHGERKKELKPRPKFDGKSCYAEDYTAPPNVFLQLESKGKQEQSIGKRVGARAKYEANSTYRTDYTRKHNLDATCLPHSSIAKPTRQHIAFDAVSSMRRDFIPPPKEAYTPSINTERRASTPKPIRPKFDGDSSMRRDFTPPPRAAYDAFAISPSKKPKNQVVRPAFEAESTYDSDFSDKWKAAFGKRRCRGSILLEKQPPSPGSGREHVYWDSTQKRWI